MSSSSMRTGVPSGPGATSTRAYSSSCPTDATARRASSASESEIGSESETDSSSPAKRGDFRTAWVNAPSIQTSARSPWSSTDGS